jgi:hypothetical protein
VGLDCGGKTIFGKYFPNFSDCQDLFNNAAKIGGRGSLSAHTAGGMAGPETLAGKVE